MSAPATAEYSLTPFLVLLAERAIVEAERIGAEYAETLENLKRGEAARQAELRQEQAARAARFADLRAQAERLAARCLRFSGLTRQKETLPLAPAGLEAADAAAWGAYVLRLEAALADMETRLDGETAEQQIPANAENGDRLDLQATLTLYLAQRQAEQSAAERAAWRAMVEQTLARLDLPSGEPLPVRIEALARAVILAETATRSELLGNELRREVQLYRAEVEQGKQDAALAAEWLQRFAVASEFAASDSAVSKVDMALVERLQAVAAGLLPLDAATRQTALRRVQEIDAVLQTQAQKATALVLAQSLQDLGYQVESVHETLFAEGGMVHFQRAGWGGYFVRLRVNVKEKHFNFNVVRAKNDDANRDADVQKKQDFIAEERWCAEFPRLLATLAARGLQLDVIRQLEAGELPVQEVDAQRLPDFAAEPEYVRKRAPKKFNLPGAAS
ncbi:hypothetical protein AGMMS49545_15240 [Betaproteobacteria bacterium]|nr:hypothetical protein AGMMS49545_15130 [Betaproteobacteria bacterium]GHT94246.1 hypothetical protein AGMMS49545_15240 [Betaproteobacteria bacterium]